MRRMNMNYQQPLQKRFCRTLLLISFFAFNKTPSYLIVQVHCHWRLRTCAPTFSPQGFCHSKTRVFIWTYRYGALKSDFLGDSTLRYDEKVWKRIATTLPQIMPHESPKLCNLHATYLTSCPYITQLIGI